MKTKYHTQITLLMLGISSIISPSAYSCSGCSGIIRIPSGMEANFLYSGFNGINFSVGYIDIHNTPKWVEGTAPPLLGKAAVASAISVLPNYISDAENWKVNKIQLHKFNDTEWWYYLVVFTKATKVNASETSFQHFSIPILMDGKPVTGEKLKKIIVQPAH